MKTEDKIRLQIESNPVLLYMKGSPAKPECGFSAKAVAALKSTGLDWPIREGLPPLAAIRNLNSG